MHITIEVFCRGVGGVGGRWYLLTSNTDSIKGYHVRYKLVHTFLEECKIDVIDTRCFKWLNYSQCPFNSFIND